MSCCGCMLEGLALPPLWYRRRSSEHSDQSSCSQLDSLAADRLPPTAASASVESPECESEYLLERPVPEDPLDFSDGLLSARLAPFLLDTLLPAVLAVPGLLWCGMSLPIEAQSKSIQSSRCCGDPGRGDRG